MDGILYVLDELGRGMAQLKSENARLAQENAALRAQIADMSAPEPQTLDRD
jgi:cell division protein FtsB